MIRKYHNNIVQTNPRHLEEESQNIYSNNTYARRYEGCSNMNASSFITFVTYMLQQNGIRFYRVSYVTFELAPDLKTNTVYVLRYGPSNEGHFCILTNSKLRPYQ